MAALGWLSYEFGITHQECASIKAYIPLMQLKLQEDFLKYFDQSGQLQKLQNMGQKYEKLLTKWQKRKEYGKPFRFPVDIDLKSLLELSGPQFLRLLLHEPLRATSVIHRVVHTSLASLLSVPDLQLEQVQVIIRLQSISSIPVYHPHVSGVGGIMLLNGILIAMTTPIKYSRSTVFHCTLSNCPNHKGQRVSVNLPYRPFRCSLCRGEVKEVPQAHDLGEQVIGMFINPTAIDNSQPHTYGSHQAITVCFQDDLISGLQLGAQYNVAGHQSNKFFHAWSVQPWCPVGLGNSHLPLSTNIAKLHAWINEISVNSPWAFVTAICSYLAVDLYPTSAFFPLKYGLILSIANQASNVPIAILAVGEDTSVASRLMNRACYLAHRHQTFSCPAVSGPIGGVARWDEKGYRWFEAGPLILAAPGVCYLGDWSKFKQRNLQSIILSALESGQVSFDTQGSGPVGPTLSAPTFPLRCAVWTYWSWTSNSRKQADQAHFHTLVNVFGIPFVVDDKNETENVASQILAQAMDGSDKEPIITNSELREYLTMVATQPVTISKEASQLIRGYFVASRRVRPNCLPVGAVSTIAALSEAHARLAGRDTVMYADVVAVLYLYETAILKLFGQCYVSPPPFNSSYESELPLPIQMHKRLEEFSSWIDNYVRSLAGSNFSHFNNEE